MFWKPFWLWVVIFHDRRSTIHDPTIHHSCINCVFLCMSWTDWRHEKQLTSHWKLLWIIRIGISSISLKQKADEITHNFFQQCISLFAAGGILSCLFRELLYAICCGVLSLFIWHVAKKTYDVKLILYTFVHVVSEATRTGPKKIKNVLKSYQNS